jgi:opacity protein-like surface antigen
MISVALLAAASPAFSQVNSGSKRSGFSTGFSLGYLSRALEMNEETAEAAPKLTSLLASLILRYNFQPGFSLAVHLGYSSSTFDSLVFRRLPFSVDFSSEAGGLGGILVGAEIEKSLLGEGAFGLGILGQFFASLGINKEWDLPGLAAKGSVKGKPDWMKAAVGPVLSYRGWAGITPFLFPRYDYLWGTFELDQTVLDLKASEAKDIKSKSQFGIGLGADFDPSPSWRLRAEAAFHPYGGGTDYSFVLQTIFTF